MKPRAVVCGLMLAWSALAGERFPVQIDAPTYPPLASQARIEGVVKLTLTLDTNGKVVQADVQSGNSILARAAQANAFLWRFAAPCSDTAASAPTIEFTYEFKLEGKAQEKPSTHFRYEHPYKVTVVSQAQHWMPDEGKVSQ